MMPQDNTRTAKVTTTSWDTLPRGMVGLRQTMTSKDNSGTVRVTMTSQDSSRTYRVTMMSWDTLPRDGLGLRQTIISQDSPGTVRFTMTSRVVIGQNMAPLDMALLYIPLRTAEGGEKKC